MRFSVYSGKISFTDICFSCGSEFCILKDARNNETFIYCYSCGFSKKQDSEPVIGFEQYAPNGISIPETNEIQNYVVSYSEEYDEHHDGMLSDAWIYTALKSGEFTKAQEMCKEIIQAWHQPSLSIKELHAKLKSGETEFNSLWPNV